MPGFVQNMIRRGVPVVLSLLTMSCTTRTEHDDEQKSPKFAEDRLKPNDDPKGQNNRPRFAEDRNPQPNSKPMAKSNFDGERCLKYLKQICDIGPRVSGTENMRKQQELLTKHFENLGGKVKFQKFDGNQNSRSDSCKMANMIISYYPERKTRILLSAHYDTRPIADQEENRMNWNKPFVSANDGGSGIALFMEMAHHMKEWPEKVGVDFVLFDGEEYIFDNTRDIFFLGSSHFAVTYKDQKAISYRSAVNFDMVGHPGAKLKVEGYSWNFSPKLVDEIWKTATELGAKSFVYERGFSRGVEVQDDHLPLIRAGITAIDIIDFDYEHWHKLSDTADKCDAKQLSEVAKVILAWVNKIP